ncbi:MAG: hypothetical protein HYZ26_11705 [Chloroflexi bacterium]|nr:hypothetical protein [Chloroflexota bacterium]
MRPTRTVLALVVPLALAALACGVSAPELKVPEGVQATLEAGVNVAVQSGLEQFEQETGIPLPNVGAISNIAFENGTLNFQVEADFEIVVEYYRKAALAAALTERELNTVVTNNSASLVFDGHASGSALVIQIVDLGDGKVNVNVRLEDI